jgi:hypothetical protein
MVPDRTSKPHIDDSGDGVDQFRRNISVVVLNYRRLETTLKCLDSLSEAPSELIKEIIVVDNGSDPESVAAKETTSGRRRPGVSSSSSSVTHWSNLAGSNP